MGRTETARKITNEPWSSKWSLAEQIRPLFRVNGVVRPKNGRKRKKGQKKLEKELDRADALRDYRFCLSGPKEVQYNRPQLQPSIEAGIEDRRERNCPPRGVKRTQDIRDSSVFVALLR